MAGPSQGMYQVILDGKILGIYDAFNEENTFTYSLVSAKDLSTGRHNLTMVNLIRGKGLTFDYALVGIRRYVKRPHLSLSAARRGL